MDVAALCMRHIASNAGVKIAKWHYDARCPLTNEERLYIDSIMSALLGENEADALYNNWQFSKFADMVFSARRATWQNYDICDSTLEEFALKLYININGRLYDYEGTKYASWMHTSSDDATAADIVREGWRPPFNFHGDKEFTTPLLTLLSTIPIGRLALVERTHINQYDPNKPKEGFSRCEGIMNGAPILAELISNPDILLVQAREMTEAEEAEKNRQAEKEHSYQEILTRFGA